MITFSQKNFIKFIELISEQRDLYDPNSPCYKNRNKRAKIWEEIATKCNRKGVTGNTCKNLWNKLKISYARFKKNGSVVTNRTYAKSKVFELMTFLEVKNQQGNEKTPQSNENQQQSKENQQQGSENQEQRNKEELGPQTTNDFLKLKKQQGIQKKSTGESAASQGVHTLQNAMPSVQFNISGSEINLGSKSNEETPQSFHENFSAPKPNPQFWPQQRQNEDKSMEDEVDLFSTQVRATLRNLPRELQIQSQEEVFQVLSKYKTLALLLMSVSESSSNITE